MGVSVDTNKIKDVLEWPRPQSVCALHGFLGLARSYKKFIKDFGLPTIPLTSLLKTNSFTWTIVVKEAFTKLKDVVTTA